MVFDPLGHKVTVAKTVLHGHIYRRHPELNGKQAVIEKTVADPDFIARSKKDGHSLLYFRRIKGILMLMVVVTPEENQEHWAVRTAFYVFNTSKGDPIIWRKKIST